MSTNESATYSSIMSKRIRVVLPLLVVLIFSSTALGIQRTVLSVYSQVIDTVFFQYLIISSAIALASFGMAKAIGNYLAGRLSEGLGNRISMVMGIIALIGGSVFIVVIQRLISLYIGNFLLGLGIGIIFATSTISLTDIATSKHRAKAVASMEFAVYSGTSVGAIVAGSIFESYEVSIPFVTALGLVSFTVIAIPFLKDTRFIVKQEQADVEPEMFEKLKNISRNDWTKYQMPLDDEFISEDLSNIIDDFVNDNISADRYKIQTQQTSQWSPSILLTYTAGMASRISDSAIILIFPLMVIEFGYTDYRLGIATSSFTIAWALGILVTGPFADTIGRKIPLILGMSMEVFGLTIFFLPIINQTFIIILGATLIAGLGRGIYFPIPASMITDFVEPENRARSLGSYRFLLDFGYVVGAFLLVAIIEPIGQQESNSLIQVFQVGFIFVIIILLFQILLTLILVRDPNPGFRQYPRVREHYNIVSSAFFFLITSIVALSQNDRETSRRNLMLCKIEEQHADDVMQDLTMRSYATAYRYPDTIELLNFTSKVDKALGEGLKGIRKLLLIDQKLPLAISKRLVQYGFVLGYLVETLDLSLTYLPSRIQVAAITTYQTNLVEELLDEINRLLWNKLIEHKETFDPFNLVLLKEVLESLERSSNTIEDAAEIIRLIHFKHSI